MAEKIRIGLLGCGDIGCRLWQSLPQPPFSVFGFRRNIAALPEGLTGVAGDLTRLADVRTALQNPTDILVLTFTPTQRNDEGYRQGYLLAMENVLKGLQDNTSSPFVILVSSSRVYGEADGQWVDEQTPAEPQDLAGSYLLQMEDALRASGLRHVVVRCSGIYGAQRQYLLKQFLAGKPQPKSYANRIHIDDVVQLLAWIIDKHLAGQVLPNVLLAVDSAPVALTAMQEWFAETLGIAVPSALLEKRAHKRCSNALLTHLGYEFKYPTYREGYGAILRDEGLL